ncbi:ABC transporter substrate-binding protein [Clostridium hydrogenum]|uniref:ABC transporter substrate-binding protein n=1 Tax=Clostridium hydrogenum TaxID=2855764 RepID=UPI001F26B244|nr:sugar ABC transporter substrate-binding protein [Clostridium hydrogenum]
MFKKKRFAMIATLVSLSLGLTLMSGCGTGTNTASNGKVTITFSHWGGDDTYTNVYKERIAAFQKKNPNISVKVITVADNYETKLQTMMAGGKAPDVMEVAENGMQFASKNRFMDLTDKIKKANIDTEKTWGKESISQYTYKDKIFGLPDRSGPIIMYYNKDLFDKAGVKYPTSDWTIDDYENALQKLTVKKDGKTVQWGGASLDWMPCWGVFIKANGGDIIKDGKVAINSSENLETLKKYNDDYKKGDILDYKTLETVKNSNGDSYFSQGKVAMLETGFWDVDSFSKVSGLNWDIAPVQTGTEKASWPFGSALTISKDSKNQDAAWKFVQYMTGTDAQQILAKSLGDCPANLDVINSQDFINEKVNGKKYNLAAIGTSIERVKVDGAFKGPYYSEIATEGGNQIKEMLLGRLTPQDALKKMETNMNKILDNYK